MHMKVKGHFKIFFNCLFLFHVYGCAWMCLCTMHTQSCGDQKRVSVPLGLELRTVACCHMGFGD